MDKTRAGIQSAEVGFALVDALARASGAADAARPGAHNLKTPSVISAGLLLWLCSAALAAPPSPAPPVAASTPTAAPVPTLALPAPLRLQYAIRGRVGFLPYRAGGELLWTHDGRAYQARMEVNLFLLGSRVQHSQGQLTPAGLQPQRFVDRVNKDRSVDFDYAAGRIRFSEGTEPVPLPEGAQDHLSIFMQLGGLIGAAPQRYPAGTALTFPAMGIYGPESWRFVVAGEEKIDLPGGEQATVKLTRAATRSDEPNAELWLAPALGWLPARIRLSQDNGDFIDQQWRGSEPP
jgi:hypothetical protein